MNAPHTRYFTNSITKVNLFLNLIYLFKIDIVQNMRLNKLSYEVYTTIKKYRLMDSHDALIVGVSGGPDSVALLSILHALNGTKKLSLRLYVAHLNHKLRGQAAEEDARFVQNLAKDLSLPFVQKEVDIQKIAEQTKCSIEETARMERYRFFGEVAQTYHAASVAIAHNADDNAETILHRIIRGAGIIGLKGIPVKRPLTPKSSVQLIRPLLFTWRKDIMEHLEKEHLCYRTDATNYEPLYLRNKIRLELIPLLENQYNPNIKNTLIQLCQILDTNNEYLTHEAEKILNAVTKEYAEDFYAVHTDTLLKQPGILQSMVIREIFRRLDIPLKEVTYEHYTKICNELTRPGKGRHFQLPGNLYLWYEHGMLYFKKGEPYQLSTPRISEMLIQIPGVTSIPHGGQLIAEIVDVCDVPLDVFKKSKTMHEEIFDLESITMPVTVRGRKNGDIISPLGVSGHKKLKDLFMDKKIPLMDRDAIPVVVTKDQPIWVIGICIDNKVKVNPDTKKILKLTFQKNHE